MTYVILSCIFTGLGVFWWWRKATSPTNKLLATSLVAAGVAGLLIFHPATTERDAMKQRVRTFCEEYAMDVRRLGDEWTSTNAPSAQEKVMRWVDIHAPMLAAGKLCLTPPRDCTDHVDFSGSNEVVKKEFSRISTAIRDQAACPSMKRQPETSVP